MDNKLFRWEIAGVIFSVIVGSLLHFVFEWSGNNNIVGVFGAVNESTWEHLKLLFWAVFAFSIIEYFFVGKYYDNYIFAKTIAIFVGILSIIVIFYTYTGIIGEHFLVADILTFVISVIISFYISYKILISGKNTGKSTNLLSGIFLIILIVCFIVFTFNPPQINLFLDPVTNTYGIAS